MILSDKTLTKMLEEGTLVAEPIESAQIQPASIDIRLGNTFSIVKDSSTGIINLADKIEYETIETDTYVLLPGQFVLATTMEYFIPFTSIGVSNSTTSINFTCSGWVESGYRPDANGSSYCIK